MSDTIPEPSTAALPPPRTRRPLRSAAIGFLAGVIGGVVVALVIAAAIAVEWPKLRTMIVPPPKDYDSPLADLGGRIKALEASATNTANDRAALAGIEKRITALEQTAHTAPAQDPQVAALAGKLDQLAAQVAAQHSTDQADMQQLVARAEVAAQTARSTAAQRQSAEALLVVIGQLKDAIERGGSYATELAAARKVAPDDTAPSLDALAATADSGVTPRAELINSFPAVASAVARAALIGDVAQGFWSHLEQEAATLVTVRRVDGQGNDPASIAARAEKDTRQGDLDGAVKEVSALQGAPAGEAKAWLDAARARLNADHALSALAAKAGAAVKPAAE